MGRWKEEANERQEQARDERLATLLGITYDELQEIGFEIDTTQSSEGAIYSIDIKFPLDAPQHLLNKIKGLEKNGNYVSIGEHDLDPEEMPEEE